MKGGEEKMVLAITSEGRRYFVKVEGEATARGLRSLREHISTLERELADEAKAPRIHGLDPLESRLIFDPDVGEQIDHAALEAAERGFRRFAFNDRIYDVDRWRQQWDDYHRPTCREDRG